MEWRIATVAISVLLVGLFVMSAHSADPSEEDRGSAPGGPSPPGPAPHRDPGGPSEEDRGSAPGGPVTRPTIRVSTPNPFELPNGQYMIMHPKSIRAGQVFSLTIQVFNLAKNLAVTAALQKPNSKVPLITGDIFFMKGTHSGSINLQIPLTTGTTSYTLSVTGKSGEDDGHPAADGLDFKQERSIKVKTKGISVFIQTDKAIYKPSQMVHFRAMAVYPNLKPYLGALDIELIDSEGNKIKQFTGQKNPDHNGVITKELQLSDQPVLGDWKINVKALEMVQTKTFTVAEYVLPKFEVKIDVPSFFYYRNTLLTLTVGAKYTYGKKVKGVAVITIQLHYESYELEGRTPLQHKLTVQDFDGSTEVKLVQEELLALVQPPRVGSGTIDPLNALRYRKIMVTANVTEGVSDITLSDSAQIPVTIQHHEIKFLAASPDTFKPDLTYVGFLKLSQMDGTPPRPEYLLDNNGQPMRMKMVIVGTIRGTYKKEQLNASFPIEQSGIVRFFFKVPENFNHISITATFKYVTATKSNINKFKSKSDFGIQLSLVGVENGAAVKPNDVTPFKVRSTEEINTFNLVILSKGQLMISKHIEQDAASLEHIVDITFNSSIAKKLSPSARAVVWYKTNNNEIITDSLDFSIDGVFTNEVTLSFDKNETKPGESLKLKVTADASSYVGLLAVDQSVLLLKGGNDITQKDVMAELDTYDSSHQTVGPFQYCWPMFTGGSDSSQVFSRAGLEIITNTLVYKVPIPIYYYERREGQPGFPAIPVGPQGPNGPQGPQSSQGPQGSQPNLKEPERVRSEFPDTWLWSDSVIGENGETRIEVKAPDTITSWVATAFAMHRESGLGITSTSSKLTVFQPFFVSLKLPYSFIRGEEFGLQAMVFNYLPETVEVKVTLSQSDKFRVRSVNDLLNATSKDDIVWITVPSNEAQSAWFWIVPDELGQIPIKVTAQSQKAADAVERKFLIEPEGTPQEYTKSVIIDFSKETGTLREAVPITFPSDLVKGSEYIKVTAIGDMMGTSIQGLGALLKMPYGCGEQNMINFAPAIFIMDYLVATNQVKLDIKDKATKIMETGYMRELTYQHKDGSFSAFGDRDKSGSMWLTAFVVKSFHQAKSYTFIDNALIEKALDWIITKQQDNGSFSEPPAGHVLHTAMQGGSSRGIPLTAYVLIALVENDDVTGSLKTKLDDAIISAKKLLEDELPDIDGYALAIVTYALTVSGSIKAAEAQQKLMAKAINKEGMIHWDIENKPTPKPTSNLWYRPYHQAGASSIEMTAYALLVYTAMDNVLGGIPVLKWLASQRNSNGGFSSTQDTVLALQAMADLSAKLSSGKELSIAITLKADGIEYQYDTITKDNAGILQSIKLPSSTGEVEIAASGGGLAVVQVSVLYNVMDADNQPGVLVDIDTKDEGNGVTKIKACGRYTESEESGMTVMEVGLISGNEVDTTGLVKQVSTLKRVETKDRKLVFYFDKFTSEKTCVEFRSKQYVPVTHPQQARVEGYQYYKSAVKDTKYYLPANLQKSNLCQQCPTCCPEGINVNASLNNGVISVMNIVLVLAAVLCNFFLL